MTSEAKDLALGPATWMASAVLTTVAGTGAIALEDEMARNISAAVRFTADDPRIEVDFTTGCWLWAGYIGVGGYGYAYSPGTRRHARAHRLVWKRIVGPLDSTDYLDHTCRVRRCVNPAHLRVVTPALNALENSLSIVAQNAQRTCCSRCGGPYYVRNDGRRGCKACMRDHKRTFNAKLKAERRCRREAQARAD